MDGGDAEAATAELVKFEAERADALEAERQADLLAPLPGAAPKTNLFSLFLFAWTMLLFFGLQRYGGEHWMDLGEVDADAILRGEVWRVFTALTLHADFGHLFANLATGLVFAWALLPLLGSGWTWMGMVLSGAAGNLLNAWCHRGDGHLSIGASTAVFGGLGGLVGWQVVAALQARQSPRAHAFRTREIVLPLAAGLALLAYLGVGNEGDHVDIMAHGLGMFSGTILGTLLARTRLPERTPARFQKLLAIAALALPGFAWLWALGWRFTS